MTKPTDTEILNWLEAQQTLHRQTEILYVVDGYELTITHDDEPIRGLQWHGETLREVCIKAMKN